MHPFLFIHACIHASKSHFTKQFVIQHSSPVVHSGSQTPENLFLVNHVHISRLFCMDLSANRSVPAFAIGLCLCCTVLIASSYFIVVQHLLGHKAPLLFLKDIWSSFVMCLLGKPETSSMPMLYKVCYFKIQSHEGHAFMFVVAAECLVSSCLPRKCFKVCRLICVM